VLSSHLSGIGPGHSECSFSHIRGRRNAFHFFRSNLFCGIRFLLCLHPLHLHAHHFFEGENRTARVAAVFVVVMGHAAD
jgi:hypothetical protein